MKRFLLGTLAALLCFFAAALGLQQWVAVNGWAAPGPGAVEQLRPMPTLSPEQLDKERDLARWYNHSLGAEESRGQACDAYQEILDFGNGTMGYLEIPGTSVVMPIVHDTGDSAGCAVHRFGTAFPVGGKGNCPVLRVEGGGSVPETGDVFLVHILDKVLTYQIGQLCAAVPETAAQEDLCVLEWISETETVYAVGTRTGEEAYVPEK